MVQRVVNAFTIRGKHLKCFLVRRAVRHDVCRPWREGSPSPEDRLELGLQGGHGGEFALVAAGRNHEVFLPLAVEGHRLGGANGDVHFILLLVSHVLGLWCGAHLCHILRRRPRRRRRLGRRLPRRGLSERQGDRGGPEGRHDQRGERRPNHLARCWGEEESALHRGGNQRQVDHVLELCRSLQPREKAVAPRHLRLHGARRVQALAPNDRNSSEVRVIQFRVPQARLHNSSKAHANPTRPSALQIDFVQERPVKGGPGEVRPPEARAREVGSIKARVREVRSFEVDADQPRP
mmetsp:Transcript_1305/g.4524  ORF Transcript_1305/g.4524 Transcript_1305/m.4524 type:complete len:293 (-) Transcript_1305:175-1053(-)